MTCTFSSECSQLKNCPKTPIRLSVPVLPTCLPSPLSSVTWTLRPPEDGAVELTPRNGSLMHSLPGQPCNDSVVIKVAEDDGTAIGHFCPQGAIQKVQIHANVSVTVSATGGEAQRTPFNVLNARLKARISGNKQLRLN